MHDDRAIQGDSFADMWSNLGASSLATRVSGLMDMARWQAESPAVSLFHIRSDGSHDLIRNIGYPKPIIDYLSSGFIRQCAGFARIQSRPEVAHDWDRLPQFRSSVSAQQYFMPAGYRNGVSLMLTKQDQPVGVFHFAAERDNLGEQTFRMLDAIRPVFADYTAMINRFSEAQLTPREVDVLTEIRLGKTNAEIASTLFVSVKTVATHTERILRKLTLENRTQAALFADRLGLG